MPIASPSNACCGEPHNTDRLLTALLEQQQSSAAKRFAQWHDEAAVPHGQRYRGLMPLSPPRRGEQYAFEVDLDACSGCKACVTACNNLNGLEDGETWRAVGLLHGGHSELPVLQHVTTACHHCLEPACLEGCPVDAYEKDPLTGIVRHLDDQCIGCQYCILKCPYDVPQYSRAKGIVRKCDMCSQRLAAGEPPACVQACPSSAIRIAIVERDLVAETAEANLFLPGAPEPRHTLPTTVYRTARGLPTNMLPANYYSARPQQPHVPLVLMLVLTQMSVGTLVVDQLWSASPDGADINVTGTRALQVGSAFVLGMVGLGASIMHLGRPRLAYRAVMGWRTSWLSREVIAFGLFAALASIDAALPWLESIGLASDSRWQRWIGWGVGATGLAAIGCSTMIYASTRRAFWNAGYTGLKFLLTAAVLGIPIAMLLRLVSGWAMGGFAKDVVSNSSSSSPWEALAALAAVKLAAEACVFFWLRSHTLAPLRRTGLQRPERWHRPIQPMLTKQARAARGCATPGGRERLFPSRVECDRPAGKPATAVDWLGRSRRREFNVWQRCSKWETTVAPHRAAFESWR